jgi:hypothetical protein
MTAPLWLATDPRMTCLRLGGAASSSFLRSRDRASWVLVMAEALPPCRECGGALQRIESMPGHVVCGSGHLFTEVESRAAAGQAPQLKRVGEDDKGTTPTP